MLTLFVAQSYAQIVSGKVVDESNKAVDYATVIMLTTDSIYIDATVTTNLGEFTFTATNKSPDSFLLRVDHLLYESKVVSSTPQEYDTIVVNSKTLEVGEVIVKGERPLVKVESGGLVYDLEQISENKVVSNAYESLLQIPGVREQGGALLLAGANQVTIILDGRPTTMSNENLISILKNTPVSKIEKAEVMYSAPAKFHVKGAAINIVTKSKFKTEGIQGEVTGTYGRQHYDDGGASMTLLYSSDKITTDLLYSVNYNKIKDGMDLLSNHFLAQTNDTIYVEQYNIGVKERVSHNIRYGLDYHISENKKINITYTGIFTPWSDAAERSNGSMYNSVNNHTSDSKMHNIDVSYSSTSGFRVGGNYTSYKFGSVQNLSDVTDNSTLVDELLTSSSQSIDKLQLFIDKEHSLPKGWELNYGALFNYAWNSNSQEFTSSTNTNISDSNSSSSLKESSYNIYAGVEKNFSEKLSTSLSVAGEYYNIGEFDRWSVLPSAQLTYVASPNHIVQWGLSSNKLYPSYWELQESVSYFNKYSELRGNPLLVPSLNYSSQLSYIFKQKYIATLYYSYTHDSFEQLAYQSPDQLVFVFQTQNWDYMQTVGVNVDIPFNIGDVVSSTLTLNGYNTVNKSDEFHDISFNRSKWVGYTKLNNSFNISSKPNIKFEFSAYYISKSIQGIYDLGAMWGVDAGAKWVFAGDRATLSIKANDLFASFTPKISVNHQGQNFKMNILPDSRYGSITLSYKFGGYKAKERKEVNTSRFGQ